MTLSPKTIVLMANALDLPAREIDNDMTLAGSDAWSSLSHMRLILSLEEEIGRRLGPDEIISVVSAHAVETLLSKADVTA